ncbi:hypothetical protein [uncultured Kiloniella sp.]|uniref:hypothetical protein n=1 Tax=uncultured Kiloniella sp. TaxID=1133091 RepID=UPI00260DA3F3|nr:hypothetical protein [uncultured Kiloniella sp.]
MSKQASVTKADMYRAMSAAKQSGMVIRECVMTKSEVRLIFLEVDEPDKQTDNLKPKEW